MDHGILIRGGKHGHSPSEHLWPILRGRTPQGGGYGDHSSILKGMVSANDLGSLKFASAGIEKAAVDYDDLEKT
ncbi:uncharacterized protein FTOL_08582 [Fusarium torulosum]|uniref:Uncharacterized protein n=1 Tax=Fusarium torulosum TaxID=33205 RepID=A0AAE8MD19_9HYPO|nr:uncharacterized protein FTOL_08582 [Fusarium torulosum]